MRIRMYKSGVPPGMENLEKVGNFILEFKSLKRYGIWIKNISVWKSDFSSDKNEKISCACNKSLKKLEKCYSFPIKICHNLVCSLGLGSDTILQNFGMQFQNLGMEKVWKRYGI